MNTQSSKQPYSPPIFTDQYRLNKIKDCLPCIDEMYHEHAKANHFPGYAYGIIVDDQLIHSGCGGYLDIEKKIPVTIDSFFRIASMTKSFTAMAIIKLRDDKKLTLDAPLTHYIPEMQNQQLTFDSPVMTIRDLLTHFCGFPTDDPWADRKLGETYDDLRLLLSKGLYFSTPNAISNEYSNLGYTLLGYIIEQVSGISYQKFIKEFIWTPLKMNATWDYQEVDVTRLALGYRWIDEIWKKEELLKDGVFGAMGGMITSVKAFSNYIRLHLAAWPARNDRENFPIPRSSIREMQKEWIVSEVLPPPAGSSQNIFLINSYGYGLVCSQFNGKKFVGHSGGLPGFGSNWKILPEYGIGVVLLANVTYALTEQINFQVLEKLVSLALLKPRQLPSSLILEKRFQQLLKMIFTWQESCIEKECFAANFFLDCPLEQLQEEAKKQFDQVLEGYTIGNLVAENQLKGHFTLNNKTKQFQITFSLTPENPPLIQTYHLKEINK